jgi:hypothetical protein
MEHGNAAWVCSMNIWHRHTALKYNITCSKDMQNGMNMHNGHGAWKYSMDM